MVKTGGFAGKIDSVEYYFEMDRDAAMAQGLPLFRTDAEGNVIPNGWTYYNDNGAADSIGVWLDFAGNAETAPLVGGYHSKLFERCVHGAKVAGMDLRAFSRGIDPRTMTRLPETGLLDPNSGVRVYLDRAHNGLKQDPGGYDLQIAPPKDVSVLVLTGSEEERSAGIVAHQEAFAATIKWAWDQGYFCHRKVNSSTGRQEYVPVHKMAAATFTHFTSRENDPQLHNHCAVMKTAVASDGNIVALDNRLLREHQGAINAIYRAELVKRLQISMPFKFVRDGENQTGRNFKIEGFPTEVRELFSKRRQQVIAAVKELEKRFKVPLSTVTDREVAQLASYSTRKNKEHTSREELADRWAAELNLVGWNRESIIQSLVSAARPPSAERSSVHTEPVETRRNRLAIAAMEEIARLLHSRTTLTEAHLIRAVAEAVQVEGLGAPEIMDLLKHIKATKLRQVADKVTGPIWTTDEIWRREVGMLKTAFDRQEEYEFVPAHLVETVIGGGTPNQEQAAAARHAMNCDGISLVQGFAGAGKSYTTKVIRAGLEMAGRTVYGTAPSWVATEVLGRESGIRRENMRVLTKLLMEYRQGRIEFKKGDAIILDEAGMVGLDAMAEIVEISRKHGLKLILQGDVAQYRPVGSGAPFAALQKVLPAAHLEQIQRQKGRTIVERSWMRAASIDLATHDSSKLVRKSQVNQVQRAIEAYDNAGKVTWSESADAAIERAVALWMAHRIKHPDETRVIITERNIDARAVSERIRQQLVATGILGHEAVIFQAIPRSKGAKPFALELRAGDEIIFGENVVVGGVQIRNADKARLVTVGAGSADLNDPVLTVELYKGGFIKASASEFVGHRRINEDGEPVEPKLPKIQHCLAMTGHSMQGATTSYAIDLHLHRRGCTGTYVGMTRHEKELDVVVATDRIREDLSLEGTSEMVLTRGGRLTSASEQDDVLSSPNAEAIRRHFYYEVGSADPCGNLTDHLSAHEMWQVIGHSVEPQRKGTPAEELAASLNARKSAPIGYAAQAPQHSRHVEQTVVNSFLIGAGSKAPLHSHRRMAAMIHSGQMGMNQAALFIQASWQLMLSGANHYLVHARGIMPEVLKIFRSDIKTEPNVGPEWLFRPGAAAIPHRDVSGTIVGYERHLDIWQGGRVCSVSEMANGSERCLAMMGDQSDPKVIVVGQTGIEALSKFQQSGEEAGCFDTPTLLCSPYGSPSPAAMRQLGHIAAKWPAARIVVAESNAGVEQAFGEKILNAVLQGRNNADDLSIETPPPDFSTWNNLIRGIDAKAAEAIITRARLNHERRDAEKTQQLERLRAAERATESEEPSYTLKL